MTKSEKKRWLTNFLNSNLKKLKEAVDDGRIPQEWGGQELSELCALKFDEESHLRGGVILDPQERKRRSRIRKEVKNSQIVNNI